MKGEQCFGEQCPGRLPMPSPAEPERSQEAAQPGVRLAVGGSTHVALAEGRGALLGRFEVPKIACASVELGSEGLTAWHIWNATALDTSPPTGADSLTPGRLDRQGRGLGDPQRAPFGALSCLSAPESQWSRISTRETQRERGRYDC